MDLKIIIRSNEQQAIERVSRAVITAFNEAGVWYDDPIISEPVIKEGITLDNVGWYKHQEKVQIEIYEISFLAKMTPQGIARLNQIEIPDTVEISFTTATEDENGT